MKVLCALRVEVELGTWTDLPWLGLHQQLGAQLVQVGEQEQEDVAVVEVEVLALEVWTWSPRGLAAPLR